ncbi:hypothetical protein HID58_076042 [Brassica napus]|uniref:Uncharacterized protein n=1 Tax=Brassica napus TaxID=3708 RepID=A0ABQ7YLD0_BRANA|nr:uncharacterized protein LOC125590291 [Brassica napus]KAH0869020.1 hypothetical protein HID58_076042 [Brassica napus]
MTMMAVGRDGAPTMAVGRDGAPTMAVRCPTGDNASGYHIVFNLQQSFSPFRSPKVIRASVPKLLLDYVFSASSSHHRCFSASSSLHRSFSDATDPSPEPPEAKIN